MNNKEIYSWQKKQWKQLLAAKEAHRLPHALLFSGLPGMGKKIFADNFTRALFCAQPPTSGYFCDNSCHPCRLISGRVHSNVYWVEPEKEGHAIKVDQIREANEFIYQSALAGNYQVMIIHPAHQMNSNAANALLKTLEEPAPGSIIILISEQSERLPPTILSRCQRVIFNSPNQDETLLWLKSELGEQIEDHMLLLNLANGAPLAARDLAKNDLMLVRREILNSFCVKQFDPIKTAADLQKLDVLQFLDFMLVWMMDLIKIHLCASSDAVVNTDYITQLNELISKHELKKMVALMDYIQEQRSLICSGINLNKQLLMEDVLIRYKQ